MTTCPTCGSDDPASMWSRASGSLSTPDYCPDDFTLARVEAERLRPPPILTRQMWAAKVRG